MMTYPFLWWIALPKSDEEYNSRFEWTIVFERKSESSLVCNKWNNKEHSLRYWRKTVQWLNLEPLSSSSTVDLWNLGPLHQFVNKVHIAQKSTIEWSFGSKASGAESTLKFCSILGTLAHHEEPVIHVLNFWKFDVYLDSQLIDIESIC